jgi:hypothetical protein
MPSNSNSNAAIFVDNIPRQPSPQLPRTFMTVSPAHLSIICHTLRHVYPAHWSTIYDLHSRQELTSHRQLLSPRCFLPATPIALAVRIALPRTITLIDIIVVAQIGEAQLWVLYRQQRIHHHPPIRRQSSIHCDLSSILNSSRIHNSSSNVNLSLLSIPHLLSILDLSSIVNSASDSNLSSILNLSSIVSSSPMSLTRRHHSHFKKELPDADSPSQLNAFAEGATTSRL